MTVLFTSMARVTDWESLQALSREAWIPHAKGIGSTRYRVFRNVNDASEVMLLVELPDYDAAHDMRKVLDGQMNPTLERIWEATGWEEIASEEVDRRHS